MGEAKKKNEQLIATIREEMSRWSAPYTAEERELVTDILTLEKFRIPRASSKQLQWMRMEPRLCHQNAIWMEANDPDREARAISGWMVMPGLLVLHSVVKQRGQLVCFTPFPPPSPDWLDFIPDQNLARTLGDDGKYHFYRDGHRITYGLRSDPEFVRNVWEQTRQGLERGYSAQRIMKIVGEKNA
jgi:hypothetical protein